MNVKNKKRKPRFSLLGIGAAAITIVTLLLFFGCPGDPEPWTPPRPVMPGAGLPPATPFITAIQDGSAFVDSVNLADADSVAAALAAYEDMTVPVIALTWTGGNTDYYNIYFNEYPVKLPYPQISNVYDTVYFIREGLKPATEYFIWVEAVNAKGTALSATVSRTTKLLGGPGHTGDGGYIERGDYPRNIKVEPGNNTLTVWWDLSDRAGWSEIYISKVQERGIAWDSGPMIRYGVNAVNIWEGSQFPSGAGQPWSGRAYGADQFIWPQLVNPTQGWTGYYFAKEDGVHPDTRPMIGTDSFGLTRQSVYEGGVADQLGRPLFQSADAFPFVFEAWWEGNDPRALGRLVPYQPLNTFPQFLANDVYPWDDVNKQKGTPGIPIKHFGNHVTITGLDNNQEYEVWIRVPNANGERGFGVVRGIPGNVNLSAPTNISLSVPDGSTRELHVGWNPVAGATGYRLYYSQFNETPGTRTSYQRVAVQDDNSVRHTANIIGLLPGTQYFIWVAAELNGVGGLVSSAISGSTGLPTTGQMRTRLDVNGFPVKTLIYIEVNDNNLLNIGDYILEDGTFLFDYVVIFAANLRNRNCNTCSDHHIHGCTESGVHVHFNENVRHILENRSTFIQPLQDKGIKVILGLLGDWDGIGFGTMNQADIDTLVEHIAQIMKLYDLDGVDFDDEWSNNMQFGGFNSLASWLSDPAGALSATAAYPFHAFGWPFSVNVWRNPDMGVEPGNMIFSNPGASVINEMWQQGGRNFYMTMKATREAFNALEQTLPVRPQDLADEEGRRRLTITLYEFNKGRWITPESAGAEANEGSALTNFINGTDGINVRVTPAALAEIVDFSLQPWYNAWHSNSPNRLPSRLYSPLAIDVSGHAYDGQNNSPNPTFPGRETSARPLSIQTVANRFRAASDSAAGYGPGESSYVAANQQWIPSDKGHYGVMFFYNMRPASMLLSETAGGPAVRTVEEYLSYLTTTVFGQRTILTAEGGDRPKGF